MKRIIAFCYGTLCYFLFLATFLYAIAFLGNFGLTRTIDGVGTMPFGQALLINTLPGLNLNDPSTFYYVCLALITAWIIVCRRIVNSPFGVVTVLPTAVIVVAFSVSV